ncbi:MAG TPA: trypsin-like peptidase domain-containing protein [Planctomycetota bacterium]|nr:trypsin-like peptidase domain-containing protein [Planctomycetota bacterium]
MNFDLPEEIRPPAPRAERSSRPHPRGRILGSFTIASAVVAGCALAACFLPSSSSGGGGNSSVAQETHREDLQPWEKSTIEVFRDASRSVVFISNNALVRRGFYSLNAEEVPQGSGSGFVWDRDGHVVTNFHVVNGASSITVTLDDQSKFPAQVVGIYPDKELAVLKISAPRDKLHPIQVGRSNDLVVGQTALAIGNPFGLDHTLTVGVISALGREIRALTNRRITDVIQTDAAINPGNSGGPLLDSSGRLIGMNTAILSPSGVSAGIGFAVPVDTVDRYVKQLIQNKGKISSVGLGVSIFPDHLTRRLGLTGVLIQTAGPGSEAAQSGLRGTRIYENGEVDLGDLIRSVNGKPISDVNSLRDVLEPLAVGDEVIVSYVREGKERSARVRLQAIDI